MVPVLAAKAAAAETGGFTWGVAFLPLWVGDGLAAVLLIGAMVSSCCAMAVDYNVPQRSGVLGNDEGDGGGEEGANGVGSGVNVDDGVGNGGEARPSTGAAQEEAHEGDDGSGSGTVAAAANTEAAGAAAERRVARQVSSQMHRNKTMVSGAPNKLNHVKHVLLYYGIGVRSCSSLPSHKLGSCLASTSTSGATWPPPHLATLVQGGIFAAFVPLYIVLSASILPYMFCRGSHYNVLAVRALTLTRCFCQPNFKQMNLMSQM